MKVTDYIKYWEKHKVWNKYQDYNKHKIRFEVCAKNCRGNEFIDVGCGFGHSTIEMSKFRDGEWSGLDFYPTVDAKVEQYNPGLQVYYSPNYYMLKNIGKRFDSVVCSEVLEHIEEESETIFIKELFNLTKRKLILTTPRKRIASLGHLRQYSMEDLESLMRSINYGKLTIEEGGPFWYVFIMR